MALAKRHVVQVPRVQQMQTTSGLASLLLR